MMILCKVTRAKRIGLSLFVVLGLFLVPAVSYAHLVELLSSNPENGAILAESPGTITAVFNEEVGSESSTLQVFDADGNQVDAGNGGVDLNDPEHLSMQVDVPALAQGAYTVRWFVMLLDGDGTSDPLTFLWGMKRPPMQLTSYPSLTVQK